MTARLPDEVMVVPCRICGTPFRRPTRGAKARTTCSVRCTKALQSRRQTARIERGEQMPTGAKVRGEAHPNWKGNEASRSAGHSRAHRRYAADRCRLCGSTEKVERHHINRDPLDCRPENISILCRDCHMKAHNDSTFVPPSVAETGAEDPGPPAAQKKRRNQPEKQVQREITKNLRMLGFDVNDLSQPRRTMLPRGLPDLYVRHGRWKIRLWIECKAGRGRPSFDQVAWHEEERAAGGTVVVAWCWSDVLQELLRMGAPLS